MYCGNQSAVESQEEGIVSRILKYGVNIFLSKVERDAWKNLKLVEL